MLITSAGPYPPPQLQDPAYVPSTDPFAISLSSVIRALYESLYPGTRPASSALTPEELLKLQHRVELGFTWELLIEQCFKQRMLARQSERFVPQWMLEIDGIRMRPDGVDMELGEVYEYKCTWKSRRKWQDPERYFWEWLTQVKAYCHALGLTKARFFVYWVMGDYSYKSDSGPEIWEYLLTFTQAELDSNWQMILQQAAKMRKELVIS